jgi:malate dehydrogenase (oxaloacetate-decarboxylating)
MARPRRSSGAHRAEGDARMAVSRFYDVKRAEDGSHYVEPYVTGFQLLRLPLLNKGVAFTLEERRRLDIEGLLPPRVNDLETQIARSYDGFRAHTDPLERHTYLRLLQDRNEVLFFALLERHLEEMLPIVYTPTVGLAVERFSSIYRMPRGLMLSPETIEAGDRVLANVPLDDVRMIVATDSSAILGIGDQGVGGMAISIGKLSIYTAAGGIGPDKTLPVLLDVGTGRASLRSDPYYLGTDAPRLEGQAFLRFIDRFVAATSERWPKAVIQWEDLAKENAFLVLERYRKLVPSFNDDIQGTGAMALAGVRSACRMKGETLREQRIVVSGAGAGGIGVAQLLLAGMLQDGLTAEEARARIVVLDSRGVLTDDRSMEAYKRPFAQSAEAVRAWSASGGTPTLLEAVRGAKATVLLGLSGQGGQFDEPLVTAMLEHAERPIVFPLSNPTANTEVHPEDLVRWTDGRALFAAGSPFAPVSHGGRTFSVAQGNNAFVFPGIGFGTVLSRARTITDEMILAAADALAAYTAERHPDRVFPPVAELREVSVRVAAAVMAEAIRGSVARELTLLDADEQTLERYVRDRFWQPRYLPFRVPQ